LLFIHLFSFFKQSSKLLKHFSSCHLCENLFRLSTSSSSIAHFRIRWRSFSTRKRIRSAVNAVSNFWRWSLLLSAFLMLIDRFAIVVRF
jgi:hypothetical protein